jgi:prepilin-type N-terminal cleavage/methylation domain-containing protein
MKRITAIFQNQDGVTLVELLVVIAIIGILSTSIVAMYRVAITSWGSSSTNVQSTINTINLVEKLTSDIHNARQIQAVSPTQIVLVTPAQLIRFTIQTTAAKLQIIRENSPLGFVAWTQSPKFPIATYLITEHIQFSQVSPIQIGIQFSNSAMQLQTAISLTCPG